MTSRKIPTYSNICCLDLQLYATGYGAGGRLGIGGTESVSTPTLLESIQHVFIKKVAVNSGGKHCLALSSEGEVYSWGEAEDGKLGHGNRRSDLNPLITHINADSVSVSVITVTFLMSVPVTVLVSSSRSGEWKWWTSQPEGRTAPASLPVESSSPGARVATGGWVTETVRISSNPNWSVTISSVPHTSVMS